MALQEDWRWCGVCEGLVYKGFGDGVCFDEQPHELGNSGSYGVGYDTPPDQGFQEGWLWCARCAYSVGMFASATPPPPPPAQPPAVAVAERSSHIEVSGSHFSAGGGVALAFVRGPQVKKLPLTANGDGAFEYVERNARPGGGTGLVIARDESTPNFAVAGLERLFPYVPPDSVPIDQGIDAEPA